MKKILIILTMPLLPHVLLAQQGAPIIPSSFQLAARLDIGDQGSGLQYDLLESGDLDGDGKPDIITADRSNGNIYLFRNTNTGGPLGPGSFDTRVDLQVSSSTFNISGTAIADIDGDRKPDILFSNSTTPCSTISFGVLRNIATPGSLSAADFEMPVFFEAGGCESDIIVADMDGDGKKDVIVAKAFSIFLLRNISSPGNISFGSPLEFLTIMDTRARLLAEDIDTDGKPDIVVGYSSDNGNDSLSIFRNTSVSGTISLAARKDLFIGATVRPWHTAAEDFDKDGKKDLVISNRADGIVIMKNNSTPGNIALVEALQLAGSGEVGSQPGVVRVSDLNGDGLPEILGCEQNIAGLGVLRNISSTNVIDEDMFARGVTFGLPIGTSAGYASLQVSDFNNDAQPDIVMMQRSGIWVFQNEIEYAPRITGVSAYSAKAGETVTITGEFFDPDPANNIVFFGQVRANITTGSDRSLVAVVPEGASLDYITVTSHGLVALSPRKFNPVLGTGSAFDGSTFAAPVTFDVGRTVQNSITISDLDGDKKPDIVVSMGNIGILRNTSSRGVINESSLTVLPEIALGVSSVSSIGLYDLSGDGKADILRNSASAPGVFQNLSTGVGPDFITFGASISSGVSTNAANIVGIQAYDLDLDGKIDIVYAGSNHIVNVVQNFQRTDTLGLKTVTNLNDLQTTYNPVSVLTGTVPPNGISCGDFDLDGKTDIAAVISSDNKISIARNITEHAGGLVKFETFDLEADANDVAMETIDIDGDGKLEIVVSNQSSGVLSVYHNQCTPGNIDFQKTDISADTDPTLVKAADLDGDGKPELICIYYGTSKFSVFKNISNGSPQFENRVDYNLSTLPHGLEIGDIDLDGKPDIIVGQLQSVAVFKNLLAITPSIVIDQQPVDREVCAGENIAFATSASGPSGLEYQWQEDSGSGYADLTDNAQYSGTNTTKLSIMGVTAEQSGNRYRCVVSAANTNSVTTSEAMLTINAVVMPTASPVNACSPGSVTLEASGGGDGDYRWYRTATGTAIAGEVNSIYTTPVLAQNTTFYVSLVNGRCESERTAVTVSIGNLPAPVVEVSGSLEFCDGGSVVLRGPDGYAIYNWSDGTREQQIEVTTATTITLQVGDGNCLSDASDPVAVSVREAPPKPEIMLVNDLLMTDYIPGVDYQWYQEDMPIDGATGNYLAINFRQFGNYIVEVSLENCASVSLPFTFIVAGLEDDAGKILIYPNPVNDFIHISGLLSQPGASIEIWDISGRQKHSQPIGSADGTQILDVRDLAPGFYLLVIYRPDKKALLVHKIMKQ